jgi:hypothetical protein
LTAAVTLYCSKELNNISWVSVIIVRLSSSILHSHFSLLNPLMFNILKTDEVIHHWQITLMYLISNKQPHWYFNPDLINIIHPSPHQFITMCKKPKCRCAPVSADSVSVVSRSPPPRKGQLKN